MAGQVAEQPRVEASAKGWAALAAMLGGTFLGTLNNNIVNVPLRSIAETFEAPLSSGILVVVSFLLVFSVSMPLTGWLGDRLGRRRVYLWALVGLAVGALGAATAPTLPVLIGFRVVQGLATAAVLPTVMGLIAEIFGPERRARALGVWAAVNGAGQAVGPPLGGFVAAWLSWRWVFVPIVPAALATLIATIRLVPRDRGRDVPLDVRGATAVTLGATLLIAGATVLPLPGVSWPVPVVLSCTGLLALVVFGVLAGRSDKPLVARELMIESRFLRSSLAVFAQMFCLGATLVAVPLYLTGEGGLSTELAGLVVFALPASMAAVAPVSGFLTERRGPRRVARTGLALLVIAQLGLGGYLSNHGHRPAAVALILVVNGVAVALVQTPVAAGATRSPAGKVGAALGLFNLIRFAGSALGAAWVAIVLPHDFVAVLFAACAGMALAGLAGTFAGPDPESIASPELELSARS